MSGMIASTSEMPWSLSAPFRVPLHAERKRERVGDAHRLDDAVWRPCLDGQARAEPVDTLRVQRIDPDPFAAGEPRELTARHQLHVVRRSVLDLERVVRVFFVHFDARELMQLLVERATVGDVELLEAAADREQRQSGLHRTRY
jgi:hypothetical protein